MWVLACAVLGGGLLLAAHLAWSETPGRHRGTLRTVDIAAHATRPSHAARLEEEFRGILTARTLYDPYGYPTEFGTHPEPTPTGRPHDRL